MPTVPRGCTHTWSPRGMQGSKGCRHAQSVCGARGCGAHEMRAQPPVGHSWPFPCSPSHSTSAPWVGRPRDKCRSGKHNLASKPTANSRGLQALRGQHQPAAHVLTQRPERATTCNSAVPFCWPPHGSIPTHRSQRRWHRGSCNACSSVVAHHSLPAAQGSGDALRSCRRCSN